MVRRQFLKACAAAAAAFGVGDMLKPAQQTVSADVQAVSGPYKINLPVIANNASMSGPNGFSLPYGVDFLTLPNGPLPAIFHAPTWTIQAGAANNYPALANQLHTNGDMEAPGPVTPTTGAITGYYVAPGATAVVSNSERTNGTGSQSLQIQLGATTTTGTIQVNPNVSGAPGDWFHSEVWLRNGSLSAVQNPGMVPVVSAADGSGTTLASGPTYSNFSWQNQVLTAQIPNPQPPGSATGITEHISLNGAGGQSGFIDDYFCYKLAPAGLLATLKGAADYSCSVRANAALYSGQYGLALNVDNPANPQNYLLVWYDRTNTRVVVDQYLNGVMTNLLRALDGGNTFAYLALAAVKSGAALDIYLGGLKLNSVPIAVNPALVSNPYMGFMSPYQGGVVKYNIAPRLVAKNILYVGDSKLSIARSYPGVHKNMSGGALLAVESPARMAFQGWSSLTMFQNIDSLISSAVGMPDYIFYNLGANDTPPGIEPAPTQTEWTQWTSTNLDKLHAKWPNAQVYVAVAWTRLYPDLANFRAQWTANILSSNGRSNWAFPGPDERTYLPGSDNGATMTEDGVHYSPLGEYRTSQEWRKRIGYE